MKKNTFTKYPLLLIFLFITSLQLHCQFQNFADSYNLLSTVAGKGEIDDGSVGWIAAYENANAVDAELSRPHFAMADSSGNIYIADKEAHGIRKVTPEGLISTVAGTNVAGDNGDGLGVDCQLSSPNGLWVSANGTVYILDLGNSKIRRLDVSGNLETIVDDANGISLGRGLWLTPSEDSIFYASGSQIKLWSSELGIVTYSSGYSGLGNITMDRNGYLVATDRTADLVYRISKDGSSKEIIAGNGTASGGGDGALATETGLDGVRGVWFLEDNSYFVATHSGSQIWYIDTSGKIYLFLNGKDGDEYHSGDGENYRTEGYKISEPRSVSVDYDGNVLIVENDYGFVRKIENEYSYYYTNMIKKLAARGDLRIYPNPVSSEARISFQLQEAGTVSVSIFNTLGKRVMMLEDEFFDSGLKSLDINVSSFPEGIYYYRLSTGRLFYSGKMIVK